MTLRVLRWSHPIFLKSQRHAVALLQVGASAECPLAGAGEHDAARRARLGRKTRPELAELGPICVLSAFSALGRFSVTSST